ncbi:MAG: peptidoglycan DD-metalloendopeptidase family protein [Sedimentisphaerales bacterium]|nr:peptidoglycan DD-metalloendopeptidase family protein [Sedimentisphaerales bacterium]
MKNIIIKQLVAAVIFSLIQSVFAQEQGELKIIRAQYGAGASWKDVISELNEKIKDDTIDIYVSNSIFGDPAYLQSKTLKMEYEFKGVRQIVVAPEGERLHLPAKTEDAGFLMIYEPGEVDFDNIDIETIRFEKVVQSMVTAINARDYEGIQKDFGKVMLDAFPLDKSRPFFNNLLDTCGKITRLEPPRLTPPMQAIFPAHFEQGILDIKVVLDLQDKIIGLWFLPHTPTVEAVTQHQTILRLPFAGTWLVFWGGDTPELNQHHNVPNQKYAFDFLAVDDQDQTHKDEGRLNEDYYAFGRDILAPADGVVTDVIRGVRDNTPGSMNPYSALGNTVMIRHRDNEISVLAHLQQNSIQVKPGDTVRAGQIIGRCGNSGNSSEPHLHYHLQNTTIIQDATGIKCFFEPVTIIKNNRTETKPRYSPIKGDIIQGE